MFVDASAIVAILTREPEADAFSDLLDGPDATFTSPLAVFEAALGLCRKYRVSVEEAAGDVSTFLTTAGVTVLPITAADADAALAAFSRYGKGRGHPAQLNMGDCFAYAMAQRGAMPLLFKGNDFSRTDMISAVMAGAGATTPEGSPQ